MSPEAALATDILVYATIAMDAVVIVLFLGVVFFRTATFAFFARWNICGRCTATLVALLAFFGSIIYSIVTGFAGCALCLTSRVLMALILALLPLPLFFSRIKEKTVLFWGKVLAVLGICVSSYHYLLQWLAMTGTHLPCPATPGLPSCDRVYFLEFGFITIPFVALSAFALIFLLLFIRTGRVEGEGV